MCQTVIRWSHGKSGSSPRRRRAAASYDKGYARTTARDIATAAGVSLAAIGYHFGSKEELLEAGAAAVAGAVGRRGRRPAAHARDYSIDGNANRFVGTWERGDRVLPSSRPNYGPSSSSCWRVLEREPRAPRVVRPDTRQARSRSPSCSAPSPRTTRRPRRSARSTRRSWPAWPRSGWATRRPCRRADLLDAMKLVALDLLPERSTEVRRGRPTASGRRARGPGSTAGSRSR